MRRRAASRNDSHVRCHCELTGPRSARPEDRLREAILGYEVFPIDFCSSAIGTLRPCLGVVDDLRNQNDVPPWKRQRQLPQGGPVSVAARPARGL